MSLVKLTTGMTEQEERATQNSNNAYLSTAMPIGTSLAFRGSVAPLGTLFCDGSAVSRTTYPALFDAISMFKNVTSMVSGSNGFTVSNVTGLFVGEYIEGDGIQAGTVIQNINGTTIGINNAATVSRTSGTIRALPFGHGDGSTTFSVPNESTTLNGVVYRNIIVAMGGVSQATINLALDTMQPRISGAMDIAMHNLTANEVDATTIKQNGKTVATTDDVNAVAASKQPTITPGTDLTMRNLVGNNVNVQYLISDGEINGQTMRRGAIDLVDTDQLSDALAPIKAVSGPIKSDGSGIFSRATAADMGLGNVANTADADKPVSHPQARALQPRLAGTATGDPVATITDAAAGAEFTSLVVKGRTTVTGTPSPDAPATISGASPTQIAVSGTNLSNIPNQNVQFTNSYLVNYQPTAPRVKLLPSTKYTIAFDYAINNASSDVFLGVGCGDAAYSADIEGMNAYTQNAGRRILTFTTPAAFTYGSYLWIRFARLSTPGNVSMDVSNVIVTIGEYATLPYATYTGQTIMIAPSAPMYDDDTYDARSGVETHNRGASTYNGNSSFGYLSAFDITDYAVFSITQPTAGALLQSTRFNYVPYVYTTDHLVEGIAFDSGHSNIYIKIAKSRLSGWSDSLSNADKLSLFKTWLGSHNVMVLYQMVTPTVTQHTPVDIPQPSLIANITADGAPVSVDYTKDLAAVINKLQAAIVALGGTL